MDFQPEKESWPSYAERLDHFFKATKVVDDDQKKAALIVANNPSFHTLLMELSFPIIPKTMTYTDVMDTMERHYVGVKNIFRQRKLFYSAVLKPSEKASEWYRRLKSLAIDCEFGDLLEDFLVDKFVCGFEGKILHSLYAQDENLNLLKALEIAQFHEIDLDVDNESIEDIESDDFSEDQSNVESEDEEAILQDDHVSYEPITKETQENVKRGEESILESTRCHQELQILQNQTCSQPNFVDFNNFVFLPRRRTVTYLVSQKPYRRVSRQNPKSLLKHANNNQQQKEANHQKPKTVQKLNNQQQVQKQVNHHQKPGSVKQPQSQPQKQQKTVQKQNNQQQVQKQVNHHQKPESVKQPQSQPQKQQTNNTKQHQSNQKPIKSQHQQSNNKPSASSSKIPSTTHIKPQQSRSQHQSLPKSVNHQQKSQTFKTTTITTKTETMTTTKTSTKAASKSSPKKIPTSAKSHK